MTEYFFDVEEQSSFLLEYQLHFVLHDLFVDVTDHSDEEVEEDDRVGKDDEQPEQPDASPRRCRHVREGVDIKVSERRAEDEEVHADPTWDALIRFVLDVVNLDLQCVHDQAEQDDEADEQTQEGHEFDDDSAKHFHDETDVVEYPEVIEELDEAEENKEGVADSDALSSIGVRVFHRFLHVEGFDIRSCRDYEGEQEREIVEVPTRLEVVQLIDSELFDFVQEHGE